MLTTCKRALLILSPHHKHLANGAVINAKPISLSEVLAEIEALLSYSA